MNNSNSTGRSERFDFSRPAPGYSGHHIGSSRGHNPSPHLLTPKTEQADHQNSPSKDGQYYQGSDFGQHFQALMSRPPPSPPKPVIPRMFSVPPPPPPSDPYGSQNVQVPPGGYIVSSTFYLPPDVGAGQYQGNIQVPQIQLEYGNGYSQRSNFNNHLHRKRNYQMEYHHQSDSKGGSMKKKKKKPLSQNMPAKKGWTIQDAQRALDVERDYNKRYKSPSLIIKFPDLELNRDIVSKFHPKIDSVHFQQPSTPRFCFVTLKDPECMEEVIRELSKTKFGHGYLTAEPKNNKEEDQVRGPEDIDPLTLYVGNLAQEVTVEDVMKVYPKHKRIDIGFAKKMKYTRYAFVCFRTVDDSIEAFQSTHATEMYNKSIIVRFRRLHGTVGLPGDPKPQNTPKQSAPFEANIFIKEEPTDIDWDERYQETSNTEDTDTKEFDYDPDIKPKQEIP